MQLKYRVMAASVAIGSLALLPHLANSRLQSDLKYHGDLWKVVQQADEGDLIPINIVLTDQVSRSEVDRISQMMDRDVRYSEMKTLLTNVANRSQGPILDLLRAEQGKGRVSQKIRPLWLVNVIGTEATPGVIRELAERSDVAMLSHNPKVHLFDVPVDSGNDGDVTAAITCGVQLIGAPRVWNELNITGRNSVVAVIDTGACHTHPDLANQIWANPGEIPNNGIDDDGNGFIDDIRGWNFDFNNNNTSDNNGHGTHCSGTVGGDGTNGTQTGVAPDVKIMILRVGVTFGDENDVWSAMQYSANMRADAWSMSLGWPHSVGPNRRVWRDGCRNAIAMGTTPVIAAGNEGGGTTYDNVRTPGDVPEVITCGATDCNDNIASFSSRGPVTWQNVSGYNDWPHPPGKMKPTVSAPGVDTVSTRNNCTGYTTMSGTSMATPHIAGVVALMYEANPNLTPERVKDILKRTAIDRGTPLYDNSYGAGRVDAYQAVLAAMAEPKVSYPSSYRVWRGVAISGNVNSLFWREDVRLDIESRVPIGVNLPSSGIEVEFTAVQDNPSVLRAVVEAHSTTTSVRQHVYLFNFRTNVWVKIDDRQAPNVDTPFTVNVTSGAGDYIQDGTRKVLMRVGYFDFGAPIARFTGKFDQTYIQVVP